MVEKLPSYGGQAVIEGVMMRGRQNVAMATRSPAGQIVIHTEPLSGIYTSAIARIPFIRGLVMLWDALGLGFRMLTLSANQQLTEGEGEGQGEGEKIEGPMYYLTLAASLAIGIGLFFVLPAVVGQFAENLLKWNAWWGNLLEGILRLILLIVYMWAIGKMSDIQRVYAYHGAEHKTINAFEAGAELTPEVVAGYSREHPRCGTAFLLTLVLLSVVVFSLLGPLPVFWRLASRIIMLPLLAGVAYEYLRWTANHLSSPFVKVLVRPNLALQNLTTREPTLEMLEVSIAAFHAMREKEENRNTTIA